MKRPLEKTRITWQGIEVEIRYCKRWLSTDIDGYNIAHLEIKAVEPERARLPLSKTGYRSHFCHHADIVKHGGAVAFVTAWLDSEAKSREWQDYVENSRQADLFEL